MKIKLIIEIIVAVILAGWAATSTSVAVVQTKRANTAERLADSLQCDLSTSLTLPRKTFDVHLSVDDNSKLTVYGKKSENLTVPATKTYVLKLDSVSLKQFGN